MATATKIIFEKKKINLGVLSFLGKHCIFSLSANMFVLVLVLVLVL